MNQTEELKVHIMVPDKIAAVLGWMLMFEALIPYTQGMEYYSWKQFQEHGYNKLKLISKQ